MKSPVEFATQYLAETVPLFERYATPKFEEAIKTLVDAYSHKRPVFICGNGGSAGTSNHMVNDLIKGTVVEGKQRLKVIGLADNMSTLTAYANDCGYETVFVEQLKTLWEKGSVLIAISASGNSENVVRAAQFTKDNGGKVIALVGFKGGKLKDIAHTAFHFESHNYGSVEDCQLMFSHLSSQYLHQHIKEAGLPFSL